jgi:2-polyprenyl-3-methyl-5-hydroxy-6-metoxy-1,4-benzoquinol methylase
MEKSMNLERSGITVVGVDASKSTTATSLNTLDVDVTLALGGAVSARAVEFAVVVCVEVDDLERLSAKWSEEHP